MEVASNRVYKQFPMVVCSCPECLVSINDFCWHQFTAVIFLSLFLFSTEVSNTGPKVSWYLLFSFPKPSNLDSTEKILYVKFEDQRTVGSDREYFSRFAYYIWACLRLGR